MRAKITPIMEDLAREILELHGKLAESSLSILPAEELMKAVAAFKSRTRHLCNEILEAQTQTPRQERIRKRFIEAAKLGADDLGDGALEIDDDALLSLGGKKGGFVEAWLWVPADAVAAARKAEIERQQNHEAARAKEAARG